MPLRSGPRNCGQSAATLEWATAISAAMETSISGFAMAAEDSKNRRCGPGLTAFARGTAVRQRVSDGGTRTAGISDRLLRRMRLITLTAALVRAADDGAQRLTLSICPMYSRVCGRVLRGGAEPQ